MKRILIYTGVVVAILCIALTASLKFLGRVDSTLSAEEKPDPALVKRGEYLARMSNCTTCHTSDNGAYYAGGLSILTHFGKIYSDNISPDPVTGIGNYTLADFDKTVRHGVRPDGTTLYPAMPYPSFAKMKDEDIRALYAFFMLGVKPVVQNNKPDDISWPFSLHWTTTAWRLMFAPKVIPFQSTPGADATIERGEYIVTTLGHCGACHTPRGFALQEEAYNGSSVKYLSGGAPVNNWLPISLRDDDTYGIGNLSEDDLILLLKTGRTNHSAVSGGMTDVVAWSTQYYTDDDLKAVAKYLKTLPDVEKGYPQFANDGTNVFRQDNTFGNGKIIYTQRCAICHLSSGTGIDRLFPSLANNPIVMAKNPVSSINIVLNGAALPPSFIAQSAIAMPAFRDLSDQDISDVVNYIRNNWGNAAEKIIEPKDVETLRQQTNDQFNNLKEERNGWSTITPQPAGKN